MLPATTIRTVGRFASRIAATNGLKAVVPAVGAAARAGKQSAVRHSAAASMVHARAITTTSLVPANATVSRATYVRLTDPQLINVEFAPDNSSEEYHAIWLRDNCRCPKCLDATTQQRKVESVDIPLDLQPQQVTVTEDGHLKVVWPRSVVDPEGHVSLYSGRWLATKRSVPISEKKKHTLWCGAKWPAGENGVPLSVLPHVSNAAFHTNAGLLEFYRLLNTFGFAFIRGVEPTEAATEEACSRLGVIRSTFYSPRMWTTHFDPTGTDSAYSTAALAAHTDGTYFQDPPGLQIFHAIKADEGGGFSLYTDGFKVAEIMREKHPESFEYFSKTVLPFNFLDSKEERLAYHKVFELDAQGRVEAFTWNNYDRAPDFMAPTEVPTFYQHLRNLTSVIENPEMHLRLHLKPGWVIALNNRRVTHARTAYSATSGRILSGCYISTEDYLSSARALETRTQIL